MADPRPQEQQGSIRIPLYNSERNPNRNSVYDPTEDEYFLNCYPEIIKNYASGEEEIVFRKRPPMTKSLSPNINLSSHIAGTTSVKVLEHISTSQFTNIHICAIFDDNGASTDSIRIIQFNVNSGSTALLGTIDNTNTTGTITPTVNDEIFITEGEMASGGNLYPALVVSWKKYQATNSDLYYIIATSTSPSGNFSGGTFTQVTAASCPTILGKTIRGPVQQLNGIFYVMGIDGYIYGSGGATGIQNDITEWNSLNKIKANQTPDAGIGVYRYKHHLLAFSRYSIEFYNDVANEVPSSALGLTDQAYIKLGIFSPKQVKSVEDTIYFIGSSKEGVSAVYKLDGYTTSKISSVSIENSLNSLNSDFSPELRTCRINGRGHLFITGYTNNNKTYGGSRLNNVDDITTLDTYNPIGSYQFRSNIAVYNISDNLWWNLNFDIHDNSSFVDFYPANQNSYSWQSSSIYCLMWDNGNYFNRTMIYQFDGFNLALTKFLDSNGSTSTETTRPYSCFIKTNNMSFGDSNRKKVSKARLGFLQAPISTMWGYPTTTQSIYLGVKRNQNPGIGTLVFDEFTYAGGVWRRRILGSIGHQDNIYWNNLGQGRTWQFGIYYYGDSYFSPSYLDINLINGTK